MMTNQQVSRRIPVKAARLQAWGNSPTSLFLRLNKRIWNRLPTRVRDLHLIRSYGVWLHTLVCLGANRQQYFGTFFLRNRPALELIRRLYAQKAHGATLRIAVLAGSAGAEVYSILWTIRSARPDLKVVLHAVDISKEILNIAERGVYGPNTSAFVGAAIFERLTSHEKREMFDWEGEQATVKSWIRKEITWKLGDAADPELVSVVGLQDLVVGNNFLCHMAPADAERCLRNMARLVAPGGHILVSGVDLDVRTKVALDLGWKPIPELIAEIHDGDPFVRAALSPL